jgi:ParB/RepB/Spo0J family partition protein
MKLEILEIPVEKVRLHEAFQFRNKETLGLEQLAESIERVGLIHPPTVRPVGDLYELVAGYRRFMAVTDKLHWKACEFRVVQLDDVAAMSIALAENASRKDLTPIEEAKAFRSAIQMGMKAMDVAEKVGKSEPYVSNRMKLLELIPAAVKAIDEGKISPGHAEHALFLLTKHEDLQKDIVRLIIKDEYDIADAKREAKNVLHEKLEKLEFAEAVKNAKFPRCPKCGAKPGGYPYGQHGAGMVRCSKEGQCRTGYSTTEWDVGTGKINPDQLRYASTSIKAAQEARAKMEAPRTAYFDMTMEQVNRIAHRKALELLKAVDPSKTIVHISTSTWGGRNNDGRFSEGRLDYGGDSAKAEFELGTSFQAEAANPADKDAKKFVKTSIPYGEPKRADYKKMAEILDYPAQLRHNGKPVKEGPGKVLSSKLGKKKDVDA